MTQKPEAPREQLWGPQQAARWALTSAVGIGHGERVLLGLSQELQPGLSIQHSRQ